MNFDLEKLPKYFSQVKIVSPSDKTHVFKDECICSYDTAESPDGLYICMKTFEAVGTDFLDYHFERYGHPVYLHHKRIKYKLDKPEGSDTKPKRLAIGLEGGFDPEAASKDFRFEDSYSLFIMPERCSIQLPNPDLPELILQSVKSIIETESSELKETNINIWDGEQRQVSKYANDLEQLTPAPKIPPSDWKCEKCDLKENLWLNLTDGTILCGRRFFDGSGGNNHAVDHYKECKYPLAVKLGTITADGADVYSYPEEDMVIDPHLATHLSHFGIDIQKMTKTDKSMLELEVDINEKLGEWSVIQEEGKNLQPVSGPGFTGLANLGNSCYMNSVLQVLFSIEDFQNRYFPPLEVYQLCDGFKDFNYQMAKLAYGLLSGKYASHDPVTLAQKGIQPKTFKNFVCGNDRNFSTKRQQDAHEFFLFLLDSVERNHVMRGMNSINPSTSDPSKCFEFVVEDRIQCSQSKKVKYTHRVESCLPLHIDLDLAKNREEIEAAKASATAGSEGTTVRPRISLESCIQLFASTETLSDFYSTAIQSHTTAEKSSRVSKFPNLLVFQMKKFQCGKDWVPRKLDVEFEVPDIIDLENLVGKGLQPGEVELDETDSFSEKSTTTAQTAVTAPTGSAESSSGSASVSAPTIEPDSTAVENLLAMGIDIGQAIEALKKCNNDAQRAIEYIFDPDSFNSQQVVLSSQYGPQEERSSLTVATRSDPLKMKLFTPDSKPKLYQLKAFISHMGTSTVCGHYVCHIKKDEQWYIFNDNKVAVSEHPPREFGYLYFYERIST